MEGPFISKVKKGAQDERHIIQCNEEICQRFLDASEGWSNLLESHRKIMPMLSDL